MAQTLNTFSTRNIYNRDNAGINALGNAWGKQLKHPETVEEINSKIAHFPEFAGGYTPVRFADIVLDNPVSEWGKKIDENAAAILAANFVAEGMEEGKRELENERREIMADDETLMHYVKQLPCKKQIDRFVELYRELGERLIDDMDLAMDEKPAEASEYRKTGRALAQLNNLRLYNSPRFLLVALLAEVPDIEPLKSVGQGRNIKKLYTEEEYDTHGEMYNLRCNVDADTLLPALAAGTYKCAKFKVATTVAEYQRRVKALNTAMQRHNTL